uniref:Peptidase M12A domain-containing protein n=1 Tax=Meloidogyne incognita TaxID=6306 RepID=A0A914N5Z6_MELIC
MVLNDDNFNKRKRRQAQTGRNFPKNQWEPSKPVPYIFDPKLNENARKLVRLAAQFWTENTCLSFAENGQGNPKVRIFPGGGCYSQVGRAFNQGEQMISLGHGCEQKLIYVSAIQKQKKQSQRGDQSIKTFYINLINFLHTRSVLLCTSNLFNRFTRSARLLLASFQVLFSNVQSKFNHSVNT